MHLGTYKTNSMSIAQACSGENMQDLDVIGKEPLLDYKAYIS